MNPLPAKSNPRMRSLVLAILIALALGLTWQPAGAAPAAQNELPPGYVEYSVQAGDSLFGIAEQFGISVDALAEANEIADPTYIAVGQILVIPPPEKDLVGFEHTIKVGDTLQVIALRYGMPFIELAKTNHILRPDFLPLGASLVIPASGDQTLPPMVGGHPQPAPQYKTFIGQAVTMQVSPWMLAEANRLHSPYWVCPPLRLWLPGSPTPVRDLPPLLSDLSIHPLPLKQGQTFSIEISSTQPISFTGSFLGKPITFFRDSGNTVALIGIDAMSAPSIYSLAITGTTTYTAPIHQSMRLPVTSGEYGYEEIAVPDEIADQMTAEIVLGEAKKLTDLFAVQSSIHLWEGLFTLPTPSIITSLYGTRRSYNIPNGSEFHSGTDFGTSTGTPVLAPAAGVVIFTGPLTVRGNAVILDHGWGVMTGYWHLTESLVNPGDHIVAGDQIAISGGTGLSTGPHLHWEIRVGGVPVDGMQWLNSSFP